MSGIEGKECREVKESNVGRSRKGMKEGKGKECGEGKESNVGR